MNVRMQSGLGRSISRVFARLAIVALAACGGGADTPATDQGAVQETAAELEARARGIHDRVATLDTHKDISGNFANPDGTGEDPGVRAGRKVDLPQMRDGGLDIVFFVVYVGQPADALDAEGYAAALESAMAKFTGIHRMTDEMYADQIGFAGNAREAEALIAEGKLVAAIGIENGFPMGEDLSLIARFKELGAGYMSITHNGHNQLGDSQTPADDPMHGGLSELGRRAVAEMNRQGIMVDVSHAGKETMMQVLEVSQAPVIASHSGVAALREHGRNLDDEQLLALKDNGGVIQVVAFASYVKDLGERQGALAALREELGMRGGRGGGGRGGGGRGGRGAEMTDEERQAQAATQAEYDRRVTAEIDPQFPNTNVQDFVDHIDYAVNLIGIEHVAISSDFDGGGGVDGWNNADETFNVTLELVKRGYSEEDIARIWSGNTLRVWAMVGEIGARIQAEGDM